MMNMFKADMYRMLRSKGMYAFIAVVVAAAASAIAFKTMVGFINGYDPTYITNGLKTDVRNAGMNFNYYYMLLIPTSVLLITDFGEKTIKNTLSSVTTKTKYYGFKWLLLQCVGVISFLFGNTVYYSFNRLINGSQYSSEATEYFSIIVMQLPAVTAIISLFVFLSFVIRKSSVFNLFALVVPLAYSSLIGLLTLFDSTKEFAQQYMTRLDFSNVFQDIAGRVDMTYIVKIIAACIILTILFFFAGLRIYNRSEAVQ